MHGIITYQWAHWQFPSNAPCRSNTLKRMEKNNKIMGQLSKTINQSLAPTEKHVSAYKSTYNCK
jgi:hypothetical protein